jgi:hypothetical protein
MKKYSVYFQYPKGDRVFVCTVEAPDDASDLEVKRLGWLTSTTENPDRTYHFDLSAMEAGNKGLVTALDCWWQLSPWLTLEAFLVEGGEIRTSSRVEFSAPVERIFLDVGPAFAHTTPGTQVFIREVGTLKPIGYMTRVASTSWGPLVLPSETHY